MDRSLYIAMTGAAQTLHAQAVNANNLANVSTTGFKADLAQFRSMPVFGPGLPSRAYSMTEKPGADFGHGPINTTGRELDVAINGNGWIAVQANDGREAYTRAGDLRIDANGLLVTGSGLPVIGNGGPIAIPPAEKMEIGTDGTITIRPLGQEAQTLAVVDRIKLVNPPQEAMRKGEDGLFDREDGEIADPDARVNLISGAVEGSNASVVDALVDMIDLSRRFEMQVKAMKAAEENDKASTQMMRMG